LLGELSHPHTPAGFVYLKFVWEPSLPLFFGGESYKPATFEGFVNLNFMRGTAPHEGVESPVHLLLQSMYLKFTWEIALHSLVCSRHPTFFAMCPFQFHVYY
jgi:hypothetical protein